MNHRSGWAEEHTSPDNIPTADIDRPKRRIIVKSNSAAGVIHKASYPKDVLIVASKLKVFIKAKYDMNTSGNVMERLSDLVREICDDAAEQARIEGRKTIMDRDFK